MLHLPKSMTTTEMESAFHGLTLRNYEVDGERRTFEPLYKLKLNEFSLTSSHILRIWPAQWIKLDTLMVIMGFHAILTYTITIFDEGRMETFTLDDRDKTGIAIRGYLDRYRDTNRLLATE